jgi:hypothetical protein
VNATVVLPCTNKDYWNHLAFHGDDHPTMCGGETLLTLPELVCEEHPLFVMGHDGCHGAGMPSINVSRLLNDLACLAS